MGPTGGTTFHVLYGEPAALLPTGGTTFHVLYGVVSRRRMRDVVFASRPFKVGTLFCRLMTKAELLQVCRVSNHDFLLLLLFLHLSSSGSSLCVFGVLSLRCCSPQQGGVEDRI